MTGNGLLDFGGNSNHDAGTGILKEFFTIAG